MIFHVGALATSLDVPSRLEPSGSFSFSAELPHTPRLGNIPDIPTYAWMALLKAGMLPGLTFRAGDQDGRSFHVGGRVKGKDY